MTIGGRGRFFHSQGRNTNSNIERMEANPESKTYCSHYERDTCVMHFRCCSEDKWYPCHKCHNEAVGKERDKTEDPTVAKDTSGGVSTIPTERSSGEAKENSEPEGLQVNEEERTGENLVVENPDEPESNDVTGSGHSAAGGNGHVAEEMHKEGDSLVPKVLSPSSPAEPKTIHSVASATDATQLRCTTCKQEQEVSNECKLCGKSFAQYFCPTCKLLIEKEVDAYHCNDCGICRGNKADHFHCDECNVCMAQSLKGNHKCFSDRGHDPCAICYEEVFSGAIILPCFHMMHKECTERLLLSGSRTCPLCRNEIFQNGEDRIPAEDPGEDASQRSPPSWRLLKEAFLIVKDLFREISMLILKQCSDACKGMHLRIFGRRN